MTRSASKAPTAPSSIHALLTAAKDELTARRAAHAARRQLAAELADYATASDQNDLNALLDTYPDEEVAQIRDLLNRSIAA